MSKIAILTQPLGTNYGGILQAFALQHVLREMGHEPITIDRQVKVSPLFRLGSLGKGALLCAMGRQKRIRRWPTAKESAVICQHANRFVSDHITTSRPIYSSEELSRYAAEEDFDAFIVGSDQVWRKAYSPCLRDYFLGFLPEESRAKRIAYAASFGVDRWEHNAEETKRYAELAKRFDLITVREDSAVQLCKDHLGVDATHVLDPTMLVDRSVYEQLATGPYARPSSGNLFCYILDRTPEKMRLMQHTAKERGLTPYEILQTDYRMLPRGRSLMDCVMPPVEQWLRSFMDAEYVVTDSFHGTVFSIIFGKPCLVIANMSRGADRFRSLFQLLGLPVDQAISALNPSEITAYESYSELSRTLLSESIER